MSVAEREKCFCAKYRGVLKCSGTNPMRRGAGCAMLEEFGVGEVGI
jgi:hypothetical protein